MRYVYVIRNLKNEMVYVGQTKNPKGRKTGHFSLARRGDNRYLYRAIRKHGAENFTFEVLEECTDETICDRERFWITYFDSFNPEKGYNLTSGGEGLRDYHPSPETLAKIRAARAKQVITQEHRQRISEGLRRTSQTDVVRESRRRGQAKRPPCSEETKARRSKSLTGIVKHCSLCQGTDHNKRTCKNVT